MPRRLPVKELGQGLACDRSEMNRSIPEIGDLFRMPERPRSPNILCLVTGVGGGCCITICDCIRQAGGVVDGSGETAIADSLKPAVPTGNGKPHFEANIGVVRGLQDTGYAAKRRQCFVCRCAGSGRFRLWKRERARCHYCSRRDCGSRELRIQKTFATGRIELNNRDEVRKKQCSKYIL